MTVFVLLHGMFHGAWCWSRVTPRLEALGHQAHTPVQTGVGERARELHPGITLQTFVDDLTTYLETHDLHNTVLVGHSFGGHAITGAADRVPHRVRHLVYLDAVFPISGTAPIDASLPEVAAERRASAASTGNLSLPPAPPAYFGVPDGPDADWVRQHLTPHPFGTLTTAITFQGPPGNGLPATYIACTDPLYAPLAHARTAARAHPGWAWRELPTGHDAMVTTPGPLADMLLEIAP